MAATTWRAASLVAVARSGATMEPIRCFSRLNSCNAAVMMLAGSWGAKTEATICIRSEWTIDSGRVRLAETRCKDATYSRYCDSSRATMVESELLRLPNKRPICETMLADLGSDSSIPSTMRLMHATIVPGVTSRSVTFLVYNARITATTMCGGTNEGRMMTRTVPSYVRTSNAWRSTKRTTAPSSSV